MKALLMQMQGSVPPETTDPRVERHHPRAAAGAAAGDAGVMDD
jgi:hypothetical protein